MLVLLKRLAADCRSAFLYADLEQRVMAIAENEEEPYDFSLFKLETPKLRVFN